MSNAKQLPMHLGRTLDGEPFTLPVRALRRHALALGGTGSGKTIFCKAIVEEFLRYNLPVVAIDLQGDILSLGRLSTFVPPGAVPPSEVTRAKLAERMDFKVWTPGSDVGIPLSLAPEMSVDEDLSVVDRAHAFHAIAEALGRVFGDTKEATVIGLQTALEYADEYGIPCTDVNQLAALLFDPPLPLHERLGSMLDERKRAKLLSALETKSNGINRLFYGLGRPIDVPELFGCRYPGPAWETPPRARLSVIHLKGLDMDRQQETLALLFSAMYRWMLTQDGDLSGLLYIDEVAPFCPAVSKPPAKSALMMLLRQARKYGLCTLLATQTPGDLDYKALGQFGTLALGKIDQDRALGKIETAIRAYPGADATAILRGLSQPPAGRFVILNGDHLDQPTPIQGRWIATEDRLVEDQDEIRAMVSVEDREILG